MAITVPGPGRAQLAWAQTLTTEVNLLAATDWTSYTPTWTSTGTAPALGNGTITGRWRYGSAGVSNLLVIVEIKITMGSTSTYGTGSYLFSTPSGHNIATAGQTMCLSAVNFTDAGVLARAGIAQPNGSAALAPIASTGNMSASIPHTWGTSDTMALWAMYEAVA